MITHTHSHYTHTHTPKDIIRNQKINLVGKKKRREVKWDGNYTEHPMTEFLHKLIAPLLGEKVC